MGGGRWHSTALGVGMGHTHSHSLLVLIEGLVLSVRYTPGGLTLYFIRGSLRAVGGEQSVYLNPGWE